MSRKKWERLRRTASKAGAFVVSGALALSLTPAAAFAGTELTPASNTFTTQSDSDASDATTDTKLLATVDSNGDVMWPDGYWAQTDEQAAQGIYIWKNYIKGDNQHYGNYDLVTTFRVEDNVLKAIDIASEGTTFGGKWGMISNKSGSIMGYLPKDVTVDAEVSKTADGTTTVKPTVTGTEPYGGYTISSLDLYEIKDDGALSQLQELDENGAPKTAVDPNDGDADPVYQKASLDAETQTFSFAKNDNAKVVRLNVKVGDYYTFGKYYSVSESVDSEAIAKYEAAAKTEYDAAVDGIGAKNRDAYTTAVYAMMVERELPSWLKTIAVGAEVEGELSDIDTISAATKSSDSIKEALNASQGIEYRLSNHTDAIATVNSGWSKLFTSVAGDVKITVDGSDVNTETEKDVTDKTAVKVNDSGQYVINTGYAGGAVNASMPVSGFYLYSITDKNLTNKSLWALCTNKTVFVPVKTYMTKNAGDHGVLGAYGGAKDVTSDNYIEFTAASGSTPPVITVKDPSITHVVVQYGFGKANNNGFAGLVYDLDGLASSESSGASLAAADITIGDYDSTYDGTEKKPEITVTLPASDGADATTLTANDDYTLAYANNTNAGDASVIVRGKGEYSGWTGKTFAITPADFTKAKAGEVAESTYTGNAITPAIPVTFGEVSLTQGTDYIVTATDNVNAGVGTATLAGTGNYAGTLADAVEFEIVPKALTASDVEIAYDEKFNAAQVLVPGGVKPTVKSVKYTVTTTNGRKIETTTRDLVEGTDYQVVYTGATRAGTATAYVIADGNYSGLLGQKTYKISKGKQTITVSSAFTKTYGDKAFNLGAKTNGDGKLTYKSSNVKVATVDSTGKVTIKGAGKADITVNAAATGNYYAAAAKTVTLTVRQAANPFATENFTASLKYSTRAQTVAKATDYTKKAGQGTMTYMVKSQVNTKTKKSVSYFSIDNKGKVSVKAKTPRGTYKVTLNAKATTATGANYKSSATKAPVLTVKVK